MELLSIEQGSSIRLTGELDMSTAHKLDEVLGATLQQGGAVLIDLSELTFMDSTGIHAFVKAAGRLRGRGCLILHGEHDRVRQVLDLVGVDSVPNLHRVHHGHGGPPDRGKTAAKNGLNAGRGYHRSILKALDGQAVEAPVPDQRDAAPRT